MHGVRWEVLCRCSSVRLFVIFLEALDRTAPYISDSFDILEHWQDYIEKLHVNNVQQRSGSYLEVAVLLPLHVS